MSTFDGCVALELSKRFETRTTIENSSDTRDRGFGEYTSKGSWSDKIFGRMERGLFILALVAFELMLLYAMSLKA